MYSNNGGYGSVGQTNTQRKELNASAWLTMPFKEATLGEDKDTEVADERRRDQDYTLVKIFISSHKATKIRMIKNTLLPRHLGPKDSIKLNKKINEAIELVEID